MANLVLRATSKEEIWDIVHYYGLLLAKSEDMKNEYPWQKGTTPLQRKALQQRLLKTGIVTDKPYKVLVKTRVPDGYGLMILKVSDHDVKLIARALQTRMQPLPILMD
ncbi:hypothetical protein CBS101457_000192 [Exobasidium rhododendri]|nr:hypothetical protein CBS101457_000192 [Exobasidium rhododendri]